MRARMRGAELPLLLREERERENNAVKAFITALGDGDGTAAHNAFGRCHGLCIGGTALRAAARLPSLPASTRRELVDLVVDNGDIVRGQFGMNDRDLIHGLRALLPQYRGRKPLRLYRGEGAQNVRRRTYGLSWTSSKAVA